MSIEIWDKKSSINGISAKDFLENNSFLKKCETIFLVKDKYGRIEKIKDLIYLKELLNIPSEENDVDKIKNIYEQFLELPNVSLLKDIQDATKTLIDIQNYIK